VEPHEDNFARDIILDSISDGVFTVDDQWRITSFNRAAAKITGVPREQALGRHSGNRAAAREPGITPGRLFRKMRKWS